MMSTDEMLRLRSAAAAVSTGAPSRAQISAREAARCLSGVVMLIAATFGQDVTRRACAELATNPEAWTTRTYGDLGEAVWRIAIISHGIRPLCGDAAMDAALAFWASETDPVAMLQVTSGVAA